MIRGSGGTRAYQGELKCNTEVGVLGVEGTKNPAYTDDQAYLKL